MARATALFCCGDVVVNGVLFFTYDFSQIKISHLCLTKNKVGIIV